MELNHHHPHHHPYNTVSDCQPFFTPPLPHHLTSNNEFSHISNPPHQMPHYPSAFGLLPQISNYEQEMQQMKELADSSSGMVQVKSEPYDHKLSHNYPQEEGIAFISNFKYTFFSLSRNNIKNICELLQWLFKKNQRQSLNGCKRCKVVECTAATKDCY